MNCHCPGCNGYTASWDECGGMSAPELAAAMEEKLMASSGGQLTDPEAARVVNAFLATLEARDGGKRGLRWREFQPGGPYWQEWYCEPPRWRSRFRAVREEWAEENGLPVRRIYEIEGISDGAPDSSGRADSDGHAGPGTGSSRPGQEAPAAPPQGT